MISKPPVIYLSFINKRIVWSPSYLFSDKISSQSTTITNITIQLTKANEVIVQRENQLTTNSQKNEVSFI